MVECEGGVRGVRTCDCNETLPVAVKATTEDFCRSRKRRSSDNDFRRNALMCEPYEKYFKLFHFRNLLSKVIKN